MWGCVWSIASHLRVEIVLADVFFSNVAFLVLLVCLDSSKSCRSWCRFCPSLVWFWRAEAGAKGALTDIWSHWNFGQNTKPGRIWDVVLHGFSPTGTGLDLALDKILNERTSPLPLSKSFDLYSVSEKKALSSAWLMQGRLRINLG